MCENIKVILISIIGFLLFFYAATGWVYMIRNPLCNQMVYITRPIELITFKKVPEFQIETYRKEYRRN